MQNAVLNGLRKILIHIADIKDIYLVKEKSGILTVKQLEKQIKDNPIMLYMKGTPQAPECGFSQAVVTILNKIGKTYSFVNILESPDIRKNLPKVSDWPTFPQLYINGEFMGGSDIVEELHKSGELQEKIDAHE